jgi:hypothetical protein
MEFEPQVDARMVADIDMAVRFRRSLPWPDPQKAAMAIINRIAQPEEAEEAIDVIAFLLWKLPPLYSWDGQWNRAAAEMKEILDNGGSAWDVTLGDADDNSARHDQLTRRVAGPADDLLAEMGSVSERAGDHLSEAWTQLLGPHPDPSAAYQAAVSAVEVAAKPVVSPKSDKTTLGTVIRDMKAKPEKWTFELGDVRVVLDMMEALRGPQLRHGDESAPFSETQEEADAAVALALTLVRWFTTGAIRVS